MNNESPDRRRRERRKQARPAEIVAAAFEEFALKGFGAAKIADIARRAGVAKATVFVYFPTKADLFRAVARQLVDAHFRGLAGAPPAPDLPAAALIPQILDQAARAGQEGRAGALVRMLVAETRTFPDLAQVWHDEVVAIVIGALATAIARGQARGELRPGDARLFAFSVAGPMLAALLFREVFRDAGSELPDLHALAGQHAQAVLGGLLLDRTA